MGVYRLCNQWDITLGERNENVENEFAGYRPDSSFLEFLGKYRLQISRNQWCTHYMVSRMVEYGFTSDHDVVHYFAGAGLQANTVKHLLKPHHQTLYDIDERCCRVLGQGFSPTEATVEVKRFDGKTVADIAFLDFNNFSAMKLCRDEETRTAFLNTMGTCQVALLGDISPAYFYANRPRHSEALGYDIKTPMDYIYGMSRWLYKECRPWAFDAPVLWLLALAR